MIPNDFEETYDRLETPLDYTYSKLYFDDLDQVILTSNYLFENKDISFKSNKFLGNKHIPENTNLLIDSVTVYSTNPLLDNYLPIKFRFAGNVEIDFSDATKTDISNYGYIKNNNTGVKSYKFTDPKYFSFLVQNVIDWDNTYSTFSSSGRGIYFLYNENETDEYYVIYAEIGNYISYRNTYNVSLDNRIRQIGTYTEVDILDLDGNQDFTFILYRDQLTSSVFIEAIQEIPSNYALDPLVATDVVKYEPYVFNLTGIVPLYRAHCFSRYYFYLWGKENGVNIVWIIKYNHTYQRRVLNDPYSDSRFDAIAIRSNPNFTEDIVAISADPYFVSNYFYALTANGKLYQIRINVDDYSFILVKDTKLTNCEFLKVERSNQSDPLEYLTYIIGYETGKFKHYPTGTEYQYNIDFANVKYRDNLIQFTVNNRFITINVIDGNVFTYDIPDNSNNVINTGIIVRSVDLNRYFNYAIMTGQTTDEFANDKIRILYFLNERYNNPAVYKYTFHYDGDRIYSNVNVDNGFNFTLISNPDLKIGDLEIIKIIMDVRYRYSKQKLEPNPLSRPSTGKKNNKFIKENNEVGDVEQVLGLVDNSFTTNDFLKVYI